MAHWIDKKQKTRVSDEDYDILSTGKKITVGDHNGKSDYTFSQSPRDYIEMNIFTTRGTFLDSIRLDEPKKYMNANNEFDINPGIILRRNGYFSGEYDIEFNFFREIAGSNQTVLVDSNNQIYTGEYDVLIDGSIVKQGTNSEVRELDYKYFVHQISNDKKEIRLATLPIKNEQYKKEFSGLGEQSTVIYPTLEGLGDGTDILKFKNPASNTDKEFTLDSNSNITLDKNLIGGELIINDAFEIMDLSDLGVENDGFSIGTEVKKYKNGRINLGDRTAGTGQDYFFENCFQHIGIEGNTDKEKDLSRIATEIKDSSGRQLFGGAYVTGFRTTRTIGFPVIINTTITDLDNIVELSPELKVKLKGIDMVSGNTFESNSTIPFTPGISQTIPIPTTHKSFGGLYSAEFNLTFEVNGTRRGLTIYRPNLVAVIPDYRISDEDRDPAEEFVRSGVNY